MKAVILAGGFATRLRPLSCTRPKILFPVLNKPLLQWTFERLARNYVTEAVLAVFYQTEVYIKQHRVPRCGVRVTYSHDPLGKPLGTAGSIKNAEKKIEGESPFLVLNGDIFADVDYREIVKQHDKNQGIATIALRRVEDPSRYGVAELGKNGRITRFTEKPAPGAASTNLINAGVYVLSSKVFAYIPEGRAVSIEREVFPRLVKEKELYGYVHEGFWTDMGKPEDYLQLNYMLLDCNGDQLKLKGDAEIKKPVALGKSVRIGKHSHVGPYAVLGPNVAVGDGARIRNSIVLSGTVIADQASIENAIIGEAVHVGKDAKIRKGCIIGDHARIRDNVSLAPGTTVCPAVEVGKST